MIFRFVGRTGWRVEECPLLSCDQLAAIGDDIHLLRYRRSPTGNSGTTGSWLVQQAKFQDPDPFDHARWPLCSLGPPTGIRRAGLPFAHISHLHFEICPAAPPRTLSSIFRPRLARWLELVTRTQQETTTLVVVIRQAIAVRIHVLVLELIGEVERLKREGEVVVHREAQEDASTLYPPYPSLPLRPEPSSGTRR